MSIVLPTLTIEHGDRFGKLTVLRKFKSKKRGPRYVCGCVCGCSKVIVTGGQLAKGRVTACLRCSGLR